MVVTQIITSSLTRLQCSFYISLISSLPYFPHSYIKFIQSKNNCFLSPLSTGDNSHILRENKSQTPYHQTKTYLHLYIFIPPFYLQWNSCSSYNLKKITTKFFIPLSKWAWAPYIDLTTCWTSTLRCAMRILNEHIILLISRPLHRRHIKPFPKTNSID